MAERKATIQPADVLRVYLGAIDHVLDVGQNVGEETGWKRFRGMVKRFSTAIALAVPREDFLNRVSGLAMEQPCGSRRKPLTPAPSPRSGARGVNALRGLTSLQTFNHALPEAGRRE